VFSAAHLAPQNVTAVPVVAFPSPTAKVPWSRKAKTSAVASSEEGR
jgi:hypothetical protein